MAFRHREKTPTRAADETQTALCASAPSRLGVTVEQAARAIAAADRSAEERERRLMRVCKRTDERALRALRRELASDE